jgi:hypothetical protein
LPQESGRAARQSPAGITSQDGAIPLHLAAQKGCADVANLLLQRRRTKVIPRFMREKYGLGLMFAVFMY